MPSYSIRLHGPLLCPLPRPRLKEKETEKGHLEKQGAHITQTHTREKEKASKARRDSYEEEEEDAGGARRRPRRA